MDVSQRVYSSVSGWKIDDSDAAESHHQSLSVRQKLHGFKWKLQIYELTVLDDRRYGLCRTFCTSSPMAVNVVIPLESLWQRH